MKPEDKKALSVDMLHIFVVIIFARIKISSDHDSGNPEVSVRSGDGYVPDLHPHPLQLKISIIIFFDTLSCNIIIISIKNDYPVQNFT